MHRILCIVCLIILLTLPLARFSGILSGQTLIDLRTQSKSVDFSAATTTKPAKSGPILPASCSVGEMFYNTAAPAGSNLYGCTALNSWTLQGGTLLPAPAGNQGKLLSTDGTSYTWSPLGGDVSGAPAAITVTQILGRPLSITAPLAGQALIWGGSNWAPQNIPGLPSVTSQNGKLLFTDGTNALWTALGGDVTGTPGATTVAQILGRPLSATVPLSGQALIWGGSNWAPQTIPGLPSVTSQTGKLLSTDGTNPLWTALGGDVSGTPGSVSVNRILGRTLSATAPANGQSLVWNGTNWAPQSLAGLPTMTSQAGKLLSTDGTNAIWSGLGGDVTGSPSAVTVAQIQGRAVTNVAPSNGQSLVWNGIAWAPATISSAVTTVFGRTGNVTAATNDYNFSQVGGLLSPSQIAQNGASANQVLSWNGSAWAPGTVSGGYDPMAQSAVTVSTQWGGFTAAPNWINCCYSVQGTLGMGGQPGTPAQYGVSQFNTSSANGDGGWDAMGYDQFNGFLGDILSPANFKAFKWEGRIKLDEITSERFRWGFCDTISTAVPGNCVALRYDTGTDANWQCEVRSGGSSTVTSIVAPDLNWHNVSIAANASGVLNCTIDATTVTTTAAFPSTPTTYWPQFGMITLTAAMRDFRVADFRLQIPPVPAGGGSGGGGGTPGGTNGQVQINNSGAFAGLTIGGDALLSTATGALTVTQIQGRPVSPTAPVNNQVLAWNGTAWMPATVSGGGGGGASTASQLGDLAVTMSSSTVLTIGANCSALTPCNVRFGSVVYTFSASATATISSGTGLAYVFISSAGILTVGQNLGVTCSATCTAQSAIAAFPADAIPVATWSAVNGTWSTGGGVDERAFLSTKTIVQGPGIVVSDSTGQAMISVDSSSVGLRVTVPATATSSCVSGSWAADTSFFYVCASTNTWRRAATAAW